MKNNNAIGSSKYLTLRDIKKLHDSSYNQGTITRERAADDLVFYWITNWDDNLLGETLLDWRAEFNIIRKAGRQIMGDLRSNPVQVDFDPKADSREDGADFIDGIYRTDSSRNTSIEAFDNAMMETVVCGIGAWELYTEYESNRDGSKNQVIRRRPVLEANNTCYWDPQAKRLDKSDAIWADVLDSYTDDGYKALVKELTGEEIDTIDMGSFKTPEESYVFPWAAGQNKHIYVVSFFHKKKVKDKILTISSPMGETLLLRESDLEKIMDELVEAGYEILEDKEVERWEVRKYIASGSEILNGKMGKNGEREGEVIVGENIPLVPTYGERAFVEGEEHYEGVTRLAKDPQRFRNFVMSYIGDIVSKSPRSKDIFLAEQVQGYLKMYEENGADNNYPFVYQNRYDANGNELPLGAVGQVSEQPIPQSLMTAIDLSREGVEDVANPGLPQDIADPDLSGKAVSILTNRLDQQSIVYQQNRKHALRRDGEIYASMAAQTYDSPRKVTLTLADGTKKIVSTMEPILDEETGEMVVLHDITNIEFDVFANIGPDYSTKKEETLDRLEKMAVAIGPSDPLMQKALNLKLISLMDGIDTKDIRDYANKQLILSGFKEPETDEEIAMMEKAQQEQQEPDAATILAMAENKKGDAALMREQRESIATEAKIQNEQAKTQVDVFEAQTDRMGVQVDAQKANAEINYKNIQAFGEQLHNQAKIGAEFRARVNIPAQL
jgi:hypothetical protein